MKIVEATINNLEGLSSLFNVYRIFYGKESNIEITNKFLTERIEKKDSVIFIAINNNKYVGFVQLYPTFSSIFCQKDFILNDLFVEESSRKKGIATLLIKKCKDYVVNNNGKGLSLETGINNPSRKLYETLGWHVDESFNHYYWKANNNPNVVEKYVNDLKGFGIFSVKNISKGEVILTGKSIYKTKIRDHKTLQIDMEMHSRLDTPFENTNHSCNPNAGVLDNEYDGYDLVALREIQKGEEISMDYCMTEWESVLGKCECNSEKCRKEIKGAKYLSKELLNNYDGYIAKYINTIINN
jgi:GNAT superfamily N-acetyltransferase